MKKLILSVVGVFLLSTSFAFAYQSKYNWQWNDWPQSWSNHKTVSINDVSLFGEVENAKLGDKADIRVNVSIISFGDILNNDGNIKMTADIFPSIGLITKTPLATCSQKLSINKTVRYGGFECQIDDFHFTEEGQGPLTIHNDGYWLVIRLESDSDSITAPNQGDFWNRRVRFKVDPKNSCTPVHRDLESSYFCGKKSLIVNSRDSNGCVKDYECLSFSDVCGSKLNTCAKKEYIFKDLPDTENEYVWGCDHNRVLLMSTCRLSKPKPKLKPVNFDVQKIIPIVKLILATDNEELKSLLLTILVQIIKG